MHGKPTYHFVSNNNMAYVWTFNVGVTKTLCNRLEKNKSFIKWLKEFELHTRVEEINNYGKGFVDRKDSHCNYMVNINAKV
jgi:hypothetical protein